MASLPVILGSVFIIALIGVGVAQTIQMPGSSLAGAVTDEGSTVQRELNLCMNACMRGCVTDLETEPQCRSVCERKCEA